MPFKVNYNRYWVCERRLNIVLVSRIYFFLATSTISENLKYCCCFFQLIELWARSNVHEKYYIVSVGLFICFQYMYNISPFMCYDSIISVICLWNNKNKVKKKKKIDQSTHTYVESHRKCHMCVNDTWNKTKKQNKWIKNHNNK